VPTKTEPHGAFTGRLVAEKGSVALHLSMRGHKVAADAERGPPARKNRVREGGPEDPL